MRLDGEVALVTGAAQGIGEGIARRLAAEGAAVAVSDLDGEGAAALAAELGGGSRGFRLDVADRGAVQATAARIAAEVGPVSILVNNAGINRIGAAGELDPGRWDEVIAVNLSGAFNCIQAVVGGMLERRKGAIVNLASVSAEVGMPGRVAYCASKTGLVGMTRALAVEWAASGVRVNAVEPGYVRTPMVDNAIGEGLIDSDELLDRIPARRLGATEDIAAAVAFLVSAEAGYVTGRTLAVDGGFLAYGAPAPTSSIPDRDYDP